MKDYDGRSLDLFQSNSRVALFPVRLSISDSIAPTNCPSFGRQFCGWALPQSSTLLSSIPSFVPAIPDIRQSYNDKTH